MGILDAPGYSRQQANARFEKQSVNTVVLFGTSLEAQNGANADALDFTTVATYMPLCSRGWFHWANAYLGGRMQLVSNAGVGGNTYAQMRARMATDVLAVTSDWVFMGGPVNDVAQGRTYADIIADATAMLDAIQAQGRRVFMLNCAPSTGYDTTAKRRVMTDVNDWIHNLPRTRPGVAVADAWRQVGNPVTGNPYTNMTVDNVIHFSEHGAHRVGLEASRVLAPLTLPRPSRTSALIDYRTIIANPHFAGGTGWSVTGTGATATFPASSANWGNKAVITLAGITDKAERFVTFLETITDGNRFAAGDIVRLTARIRWSSLTPVAVASPCRPFLRIMQRNTDGTFTTNTAYGLRTIGTDDVPPTGIPASGEVVVQTTRITVGPNVNRLYVAAGWEGAASGTVEVEDLMAYRISP